MPSDRSSLLSYPRQLAALVRAELTRRWEDGDCVGVEVYLERYPVLRSGPEVLMDVVYHEVILREQHGQKPTADEYVARFPDLAEELRRHFEIHCLFAPGSVLSGPNTVSQPLPSGAENRVPGERRPGASVPGYELMDELGRGGMGVVYRARQVKLNRVVALKMILAGVYASQGDLARFVAEAEAVAHLAHPNIVQIFETGQHDGLPFFSLEFCPGGSLHARLAGTPLPPPEAARIAEQLARGMAYAHARGIVHRDLKPQNVLFADDGTPKITDFGLAKRVEASTALTATGAVVGTPQYMAPEQARGEGKKIGKPVDVYGLGAILYEMLTGRPPFQGPTVLDTLAQVLTEDAVPVRALQPGCPRDLETICLKCLQKEPGKRYAGAEELAEDLRRFQEGEPIRARPVGLVERGMKWARRRPTVAALLAVVVLVVVGGGVGWGIYDRQVRRTRAEGLVAALRSAETPAVGRIVEELAEVRNRVEPELRAILDSQDSTPREKLHASLALLPGDERQMDYLYGRLLTAEPQEVVVIRDALRPHAGALRERLWAVLEDAKGDPGQRLRAACALAAYADGDERWAKVSRDVAVRLMGEDALALGHWAGALRPAGRHLLPSLAPLLLEEGRGAAERRTLTRLYAAYAEGVADAFAPLEGVLREQPPPPTGRPPAAGAPPEPRLVVLHRQANAAAALAAAGRWEKVAPLLRHSPDPTLRSYLIDRLASGGVEAKAVAGRLNPEREPDVSARRALLLALGEFGPDRLPQFERETMIPRLLEMYRDDPDAGIHGAAGWLLRQWKQGDKVEEIDRASRARPAEGRRWYVNGQGQTMVLVPPGEFETEPGTRRHTVKVERHFALAAREVTVAEFLRFRKDHPYFKEHAPTEDCPVNRVNWFDAAAYCNWLSKEEGIAEEQWCYEPNEKKEYAEGMKVKAGALSLSGYRLPTEAEWELACRAGSGTTWAMGDAEELLGKYAWYYRGSEGGSRPVGLLRPNDLGLFDLHGNDWEWCNGRPEDYDKTGKQFADTEQKVDGASVRPIRGGTSYDGALGVRSADRGSALAGTRADPGGFRPAQTVR